MPVIAVRRTLAVSICILGTMVPAWGQDSWLRDLSPAAIDNIIAGARPDTPATLSIANRDVMTFRSSVIGRSAAERAAAARELLDRLTIDAARLAVTHRLVGAGAVITVEGRDIFAIVPPDIDTLRGETMEGNAVLTTGRLQQSLDEIAEAGHPWLLVWRVAQALLATGAFWFVLRLLARANQLGGAAAGRSTERHLTRLSVGGEIVRSTRLVQYVRHAISVLVVLAAVSVAYLWLTFVLRRFPYTRPWGEALRGFLIARLSAFGAEIVAAIPDLFTVILIVIVTRLLMRAVQIIFAAVEEGRSDLPWVYPETAGPTRKLVVALLWLFALITAYPYLPGADTDAFKGVSVFVGLVISLGSSGLVNQIMSGLTLTYSRALRRGDYVRVGDVEGTVSHMGSLSTKIETPRREEVTIPNAVLVSQEVTNFTRHAARGVFVATEVTIGYDAPWRKVNAMLLRAANATAGVRTEPAAFVMQKSLEDFYVRYALMVCLEDATRRGPILDQLHANIQDAFNEAGVQIMSPNYEADPGEPKLVPRERWHA